MLCSSGLTSIHQVAAVLSVGVTENVLIHQTVWDAGGHCKFSIMVAVR